VESTSKSEATQVKMHGTVSRFDSERGLGEITGADGATYAFHSTAIADGSRAIAVGTAVEFDVTAGHLGRWEASAIVAA
jgi:cold shock CspA family protein